MTIWSLAFTFWLWPLVTTNFYLHTTERLEHQQNFKHHCLQYSTRLNQIVTLTIDYCLRTSENHHHSLLEGEPAAYHKKFTIDRLFHLNITSEQLFSWSTPGDLIEDYQYYVNHRDQKLASKEIFRCVQPWFGSRCQYIFASRRTGSFVYFVNQIIKSKLEPGSRPIEGYSTCYMHLSCKDHGVSICLHWTQICDGQIDCINGEEDETSCSLLEVNECKPNEYRCHNGLCIPQEFVGNLAAECLDQSDILVHSLCKETYNEIMNYIWVEYGRRPDGTSFACGGVECVRDFHNCDSTVHRLASAKISIQGNLTTDCWIVMVCLTKIMDQVNGILCNQFIQTANITTHLLTCDSLISFPTKAVLLHHVHLLYHRDNLLAGNKAQAAIPSFICYDHHLCEHFQPTFHYHNLSCRQAALMGFNTSSSHATWISIIDTIRPFFHGCMLSTQRNNTLQHASLYCCQNSSKCISQHRLVDGLIDCPYHDDENVVELSCSIKHTHRFRCRNEQQCRSPLFPTNICPIQPFRDLKDISFQEICDRILHTSSLLVDGQNHTDETECEQWECSNIYTRCNTFWNCPNGKDEMNCTSSSSSLSLCPAYTLECVSAFNYTIICLPKQQVGDGIMDCLGGADEPSGCKDYIGADTYYSRYLCFNDTKCISAVNLCDRIRDCLYGDDEIFCNQSYRICRLPSNPTPTDVERSLCHLAIGIWRYFSFDTLELFPPLKSYSTYPTTREMISSNSIQSTTIDVDPNWYCNYGLLAIVRLDSNLNASRCFCPPNFYGDRCQYQSERVSVILEIYSVKRYGIQSFLISLISHDDDQETIHSYHQSSYIVGDSCNKTFKFLLLYSSRPKNRSFTYFVKIDAFNQINLTYLASWRFYVPFTFLPVNPMPVVIRVPAEPVSPSSQCRLICGHGRCIKYLNEDEFFCRCDKEWTGKRCDLRLNCDDCALDSVCVGSYENRSICMCPINTFGRRCLLKYSCPEDLCENGGQCVITDAIRTSESYACLCSEQYFANLCQTPKSILEVSFKNMEIPSYILVDIFYSSLHAVGSGKPLMKMMAKKLRMFQESVTFYIDEAFQIVIVQANRKHYLTVVNPSSETKNVSTVITPNQECPSFQEIADPHLISLPLIRRVKYFHHLCRVRRHLMCFTDSYYFCLCTLERHANCLPFEPNFTCPENLYCQNDAQCFQNQPNCPWLPFCICSDCFFGDRCQFYAKGIGLTLDDILRYELRSSMNFHQQAVSVKFIAGFAVIILVIGVINSVLSLMAFYSNASRQVGAGIYLFVSSITSLLTVSLFNAKVWFLIITQIHSSVSRRALRIGCGGLEPLLKLCLYMDNWLNACVAIERALTVYKGVNFNKKLSKRVAYWVLVLLPILIGSSLIYEFIFRDLYDDEEEERIWCVLEYSKATIAYNTFIISFHTMVPFFANLLSAVFIIFESARRKAHCQNQQTYTQHLYKQLKEHQHLITSPSILAILSLPRVIISLLPGCVKDNRKPWLYLSGYFISFIPAVGVFFVFVLPSPLYRQEFLNASRLLKRRISRLIFSR